MYLKHFSAQFSFVCHSKLYYSHMDKKLLKLQEIEVIILSKILLRLKIKHTTIKSI